MRPLPALRSRIVPLGVVLLVALAAALTGCGDDGSDPDDGGAANLSDSYYSASNLEPALEEIGKHVGENAAVELTITQGSVKATAQSKGGGVETITVTPANSGGTVQSDGAGKATGPELADVDPETAQGLATEVGEQANVSEDNITSISTLPAAGANSGWSIALDDGSHWQSALDGSNLRQSG
ncbi:MAG: hypothetical protein EXQ70_07790 [Solirubrobacterales bacterium]|nr:hypothetical protein [Solirubrobacterales bacterium]